MRELTHRWRNPGLGTLHIPDDVLLVHIHVSNTGGQKPNVDVIRGHERVCYLALLLKMPWGSTPLSRAARYIWVYELKPRRIITLAETNEITPFTIEPTPTIQKTTTTLDETEVSAAEKRETMLNQMLVEATHTGGVDTLKDFLSKPTILSSGVLQTSDVVNTPIGTWALPASLFVSNKQLTKLKGVMMFRADFEVTLKVNATRFQQGRYLLRWVYFGGTRNMTNSEQLIGNHVSCLTATTSANCASIDLATETTLTVTIPYAGIANYSLVDQADHYRNAIARLYLIPYDVLQAGSGVNTAQYTIYARLVNITTSGNVVLQSQSSIRVEQNKGGVGPISGSLDKISKVSSIFGTVPLLKPYTSAVGWLADMGSAAAKVWGYSKPLTLDPPKTIVRRALPFMANSDQVFNGHKLTNMADAEVPKSTGRARTDIDEMSFNFIASHFAWIGTANWPNSASSGTMLTSFYAGIGTNDVPIGKGAVNAPCDYIAQMFASYRGGVKFRITIPKTEFHSGRLCVSFVPWDGATTIVAPTSLAETDNLYRVIWDVRESNTLELEVPYISTRNFTNVGRPYGIVYIQVLNELMAPNTVPSSVNLLIEKAAMDDIEYAGPFRGFNTQQTWPEPYVVFQSSAVKLSAQPTGADIIPIESFGERVVSLRSLLKRFSLILYNASGGCDNLDIYPYEFSPTAQTGSLAGPLVRTSMISDLINWFSPLFAISSGSVRLNVVLDGYTDTSDWSIYGVNGTPTDIFYYGANKYIVPQSPVQTVAHGVEGVASIEVPAYTMFGARSIGSRTVSSVAAYSPMPDFLEGGSQFLLRGTFAKGANFENTPLRIHRAAGDDFSLSLFNGVIPYTFSNVA